ncbi:DUF1275 family protein [Planomonospora corallina]|uniref:DUF1275 family protein n=1 Tax=Planomonospora corallina TaxID=1806052 RepID=A0ABV8I2U2_9ACTN
MSSIAAWPPSRRTVALLLLTGTTGVVDAVSFLGLDQVFTAVMTGNLLFLGLGLVDRATPVAAPLVALAAFAAGALAGHRVNGALLRRAGERWPGFAVCGEAAVVTVAAVLALGLSGGPPRETPHRFAVIAVLALAMGWRNTTVLRMGAPAQALPTTVATRALAGLFMGPPPATRGRRAGTIVAIFAGAVVGALLLGLHPAVPLLAAAAVEIAAALLLLRDPGRGGTG